MSNLIHFKSASEMAHSLREGEITAVELLQIHFDQIDKINPAVNAIIWQDREGAIKRAHELDTEALSGNFRGPLHGVPITVKEAFDLPGSPSTWGNPEMVNNIPDKASLVVQRYQNAGAIIFGKTNVPLNLYEWQSFNEIYGTTNNPWDLSRTSGGSSGGSAAALACGMSALEAGSDIGSSIRNPAHYCGVFGLKPTHGVVPLQGHRPPGWFCDIDIAVAGPMARSAVDLELAFHVLIGADDQRSDAWSVKCPADSRSAVSEFKIGFMAGDDVSPVDASYLELLASFAKRLESVGATVDYKARPDVDSKKHFLLYMQMLGAAMSFGYSPEAQQKIRIVNEGLADLRNCEIQHARLNGITMSHRDWHLLNNDRQVARQKFDHFFDDWDILIAPVCASAAFPHDQSGVRAQRDLIINGLPQAEMLQLFWSGYSGVVELPSVVGPIGFDGGLPVGYQAIAGYGRDRTALAFAKAVERELGGFKAPPSC